MGTVIVLILFFGVCTLFTPKEKIRELEREEAEREGYIWQSR